MSASLVRRGLLAGLAVLATTGVTACEGDNNPYGVPYRDIFHTIIGAYRPIELLERPLPFLPGTFTPSPDGSDIRFALGRAQTFTGRIFIPGGDPTGGDLDQRLAGDWSYDVPAQQLVLDFETSIPISPPQLVFQITFLQDRVRLEGATSIDGVSVSLDLGKPLPPEEAPGSGCVNCVSFDAAPAR